MYDVFDLLRVCIDDKLHRGVITKGGSEDEVSYAA